MPSFCICRIHYLMWINHYVWITFISHDLSFSLCLSLSLSICLPLPLFLCVCLSLSLPQRVYLSACLYGCISVFSESFLLYRFLDINSSGFVFLSPFPSCLSSPCFCSSYVSLFSSLPVFLLALQSVSSV